MICSCAPIFKFFYTPPDGASTEYQISNREFFCARIIVIFWTTCIARGVLSVMIMGNLMHILPVLQWLKVVIAFVSSSDCLVICHFSWLNLHWFKLCANYIALILCFRSLLRKKNSFLFSVMGAKLSCIKRPHRSRTSHDNASSSGAASAQNHQQHPGSSAAEVAAPRRIMVSQNGRQIIRTVRTLQSGDSIVITYPRTDLKTLILDTLRLLRSLVAK